MFKHILVPIDGGEHAIAAVKAASVFAKETGAKLTFFFAKPVYFTGYLGGDVVIPNPTLEADIQTNLERKADTLLAEAARIATEAGVTCATLCGDNDPPYVGIIAAAEQQGCDLIFMASHGRRGMSALLLGSETQKVLTHCKIPVLVYR